MKTKNSEGSSKKIATKSWEICAFTWQRNTGVKCLSIVVSSEVRSSFEKKIDDEVG